MVRLTSLIGAMLVCCLNSHGWANQFTEEVKQSASETTQAIKQAGKTLKDDAKKSGHETREAFKQTGQDIKQGSKQAGSEIREGFKQLGQGIKERWQTGRDRYLGRVQTYRPRHPRCF